MGGRISKTIGIAALALTAAFGCYASSIITPRFNSNSGIPVSRPSVSAQALSPAEPSNISLIVDNQVAGMPSPVLVGPLPKEELAKKGDFCAPGSILEYEYARERWNTSGIKGIQIIQSDSEQNTQSRYPPTNYVVYADTACIVDERYAVPSGIAEKIPFDNIISIRVEKGGEAGLEDLVASILRKYQEQIGFISFNTNTPDWLDYESFASRVVARAFLENRNPNLNWDMNLTFGNIRYSDIAGLPEVLKQYDTKTIMTVLAIAGPEASVFEDPYHIENPCYDETQGCSRAYGFLQIKPDRQKEWCRDIGLFGEDCNFEDPLVQWRVGLHQIQEYRNKATAGGLSEEIDIVRFVAVCWYHGPNGVEAIPNQTYSTNPVYSGGRKYASVETYTWSVWDYYTQLEDKISRRGRYYSSLDGLLLSSLSLVDSPLSLDNHPHFRELELMAEALQ